jgi:cell division septal protein FtsQ
VASCAVAVAVLAALSTSGARWLRVAEVQVVGAHATDPAGLEAALAGALGASLVTVEVDALRNHLLADPWVEHVHVARRFPHRLRVTLKEARPVFVLPGGQGAVSSNGRLLPRRAGMDFDDLPELRVPCAADGSALSQDAALAVRRLCAVLDRSPWTWSEGLCRVEFDRELAVELETSGGARVVLGREDWGKRLRSLSLAGEVVRPGPGDRIDLRFERQIVLHPAIAPQEREEGES